MTKTVLLGTMLAMSATLVSKSAHLSGEWWFWWGVMVAVAGAFVLTTVTGANDEGTQQEADTVENDGNKDHGNKGYALHDHRASRRVGA